MGVYRDQVLPRLYDRICGAPSIGRWRARAVDGLGGRVVEIGFGSGLNVEHYPSGVDSVLAVEPAEVAWRLASPRVAACGVPVEHAGTDGQSLQIVSGSCDAALSTFTLCTIPDPVAALVEIYRVLRPGGTLHFLEHGLSPDSDVAGWQRRFEGLHRRLAGGCHLTRDAPALVRVAGFRLEHCEQGYATGPRPWSYLTVGVGRKAGVGREAG